MPCTNPRQSAWVAGRTLLCHLLGLAQLPDLPPDPQGKPETAEGIPAFNISHSGDYVAVLISPDHQAVGCDLEEIRLRPAMMTFAEAIFSDQETEQLKAIPEKKEQAALFWQFWTRREARVKQQGGSVWDIMHTRFNSIDPDTEDAYLYHTYWQGYSIACCLTSSAKITITSIEPPRKR